MEVSNQSTDTRVSTCAALLCVYIQCLLCLARFALPALLLALLFSALRACQAAARMAHPRMAPPLHMARLQAALLLAATLLLFTMRTRSNIKPCMPQPQRSREEAAEVPMDTHPTLRLARLAHRRAERVDTEDMDKAAADSRP